MKIAIVIPTYNERSNLSLLLPALLEELKFIEKHTFFVLVVDGNSPDGTKDVVQAFSKLDSRIILLLEKEKAGLGAAYIYGMKYAINDLVVDAIIEMDGDFQHDPKDIKRFVRKLDEGADYVIGSRYIRGGSIPNEWEFYRKLLSFAGNIFTRIVLGLFSIHDITSGFRISRVSFLKKINLDLLDKRVYAYKIQLLYEMKKVGAKVVEIPIKFRLRDKGESKMVVDNIFISLKLVIGLRYKQSESFFKFLLVGLAGLFVQTFVFLLETFLLDVKPSLALLPSFILAVLVTFTLNNIYSFKSHKIQGKSMFLFKGLQFLLVNAGGFFIQKLSIELWERITSIKVIVVALGYPMGIILGLVWNYLFYSRIIWRKKN